jgi:tRNA A-37 threonylcarbamoyl transferase component Bud32
VSNFDQPFQDYEILDRVGGGAMGTVFKARHKQLNRIVALKILKPSLARDKRYVERLRREARIVASLSHAHIVTGYDLGEESGYHFFVMEFVEGKSLRQLLVEWGSFSEEYVLRVAREAAEALDHAFARDVIHRDIKPGNILINESGNVKLADMGLAKGPADLSLTRDGATVGTPMYISPEQARNPQDVDVRGDLYSLGATLYHMATGVPPFSGDTMAELITRVLNDIVVPPNEVNPSLSAGLSLVLRKLLTKNLSARYQTPRELLDDLDRIERAQLPAVDAGRLDASSMQANRWLRFVLVGLTAMLLSLGAWWVGRQMVSPSILVPDTEVFLQELDDELSGLPTAGERYLRLAAIVDAPVGSMRPLEQRRNDVALDLQATLGAIVTELQGARLNQIVTWIKDPGIWPGFGEFQREYLLPEVRKRTGIGLRQLPLRVSKKRVDILFETVERIIGQRDAEFLVRFQQFLDSELPSRVNVKLRASHFAAADALWRDALLTFCDGVQQPLPERLSEQCRDRIESMCAKAQTSFHRDLEKVEQVTIRALDAEVVATVTHFLKELEEGADAVLISEALRRFRSNLGHYWPSPKNFRIGRDPWPAVEQKLISASHAVELAVSEEQSLRFDSRCDLAWRAFCNGDSAAALSVLDYMNPVTDKQKQELVGYRRCLAACRLVEQAILRAIAAEVQPVAAFRLSNSIPFALRVASTGENLQLFGSAIGQDESIALRLTELRITDLLNKLGGEEAGPLRAMASAPRCLGLAALRLVAGDAQGLDRQLSGLHGSDRELLLGDVWPRIERVREQVIIPVVDQASLFLSLKNALDLHESDRDLVRLESALFAVKGLNEQSLTSAQRILLRAAQQRRKLAIREQNWASDLAERAPRDAIVDVSADGEDLVAAVTLPAIVLFDDSGDGWQMRNGALEFAGGRRPWSEQSDLALHGRPGFVKRTQKSRLDLEVAFPSREVSRRSCLIEFDGVSLMLVVAANDSVQMELVDGVGLDAVRVNRAFEQALSGAMAPSRALVIPGGLHRLTIDVSSTVPTQANVVVTFEGKVLLKKLHLRSSKHKPDFVLHPLQELTLRRAVVSATL